MDNRYGPPRFTWYGAPRTPGSSDPNMRVSDAERQEMADTLSKHYAEGRLDEGEFRTRLDKAMSAKTNSDLNGLLYDLPRVAAQPVPVKRPGLARRFVWGMSVFVFVVIALGIVSALFTPHIPWIFLIVIIGFLIARRHGFHHNHNHHPRTESY
jgi:hypothetical protein